MKILIVEDSKSIHKIVSEMLIGLGHTCHIAEDGQIAIDFFEKGNQADLILLDWNMPNVTGIEFLKLNFQKQFTKCPIVMMTTENKPEKIREALKYGASEYIMKPFTQDILESKIELFKDQAA